VPIEDSHTAKPGKTIFWPMEVPQRANPGTAIETQAKHGYNRPSEDLLVMLHRGLSFLTLGGRAHRRGSRTDVAYQGNRGADFF